MKEDVIRILKETGAIAITCGKAEPVEDKAWRQYMEWLEKGHHAGMTYLENHLPLRRDPRLLLEGAETIITLAYPFKPERYRPEEEAMIACYAFGDDYHDILRNYLKKAVGQLSDKYGGSYRICIDSAPIMERYWAVRTGLGTIGENGSVIVSGGGNMVFLAEILTTLQLHDFNWTNHKPSRSALSECNRCGACRKVCPAGAILKDGTVDSRRCLSYLTIEHKGDWPTTDALKAMTTKAGRNIIFGCDLCLRACHLNHSIPPTSIIGLKTRHEIFSLSKSEIEGMTQEEFSHRFSHSPIKRAKLAGLKRNIINTRH